MVQHREIQAVDTFDILQLTAGDVAHAGTLDFDHVGTEPRQQLRAGRAGLDMGKVEDFDAVECFAHLMLLPFS